MTHAECTYLLYKAHTLWHLTKVAAAKGERFVPSNHFDPITPAPLEAQARIFATADGTELALCLRHATSADVPPDAVARAARAFFGDAPYTPAPPWHDPDGGVYHGFYSPVVPPSVLPITGT